MSICVEKCVTRHRKVFIYCIQIKELDFMKPIYISDKAHAILTEIKTAKQEAMGRRFVIAEVVDILIDDYKNKNPSTKESENDVKQ